ncbi:MAG TPA: hypothetical protein VHF06_32580 [Pseudonocardiaceae bacterium]|nr:hypothetical protein [Pseudonocardiaceae bacterium]
MVEAMVLACGRGEGVAASPVLAGRSGVTVHKLPSRPGKDDVDDLLGDAERIVVVGEDADFAAVVVRLLRTERLADVPVGFVPVERDSDVAITWDLPEDTGRALDVALTADADRVPLIRDDNGGVLVGLGEIGPLRGVAYCDDTRVLRGPARRIRVTPYTGGIEVTVAHRGFFNRRARTTQGRAFELGCLPTRVVKDGVVHDRPVKKWHWYRHTEDLRLIRGLG